MECQLEKDKKAGRNAMEGHFEEKEKEKKKRNKNGVHVGDGTHTQTHWTFLVNGVQVEEGPKTVGITDASSRRLFGCREVVQVMAGSETKSGLSLPLMVVRHAGKIGVCLFRR